MWARWRALLNVPGVGRMARSVGSLLAPGAALAKEGRKSRLFAENPQEKTAASPDKLTDDFFGQPRI